MTDKDNQELRSLLSLCWPKSPKMVDFCMKSTAYVRFGELFCAVTDAKPRIISTLWYDDERDDPGSGFEHFRRENISMNTRDHLAPWKCLPYQNEISELSFIVAYNDDKTGGRIVSPQYPASRCDSITVVRKVTPEELAAINAAISEVNADYEKRLRTYYNKYSKNVVSRGFWVNQ